MPTESAKENIRAAGGLLWRQSGKGHEIAIVHRNRYGDWTLPKGKLNPSESWQHAALREVREETGYEASILEFAGTVGYEVDGRPKVVRFWHMTPKGDSTHELDDEVAEVAWLSADSALKRLTYPVEQALLESALPPKLAEPRSYFMSVRKKWRYFVNPALTRLENTMETFQPELESTIRSLRLNNHEFAANWDQTAEMLLEVAKRAIANGDADLGWRCVNVADRLSFHSLAPAQLILEAKLLLAQSKSNDLSNWRSAGMQRLLLDGDGKPADVSHLHVIRAKRILDEHHENTYQKQLIVRSRLRILTLASLIAIAVWLALQTIGQHTVNIASAPGSANSGGEVFLSLKLWIGVLLAGAFGAIVSGFSSAIGLDARKSRIPAESFASTVTFARLSLGMVSALAVSIFLLSGILKSAIPSYESMLAIAFVAGFTERFLIRAIDTVTKPQAG